MDYHLHPLSHRNKCGLFNFKISPNQSEPFLYKEFNCSDLFEIEQVITILMKITLIETFICQVNHNPDVPFISAYLNFT